MNSLTSQSQSEYQKRSTKLNNIHLPLASLALAIAAVNYAPVAAAQSDNEAKNLRFLEEVVVTARRKEESMQDVPIAITAMDEDYLRTQNITEIEALGTHIPSMRISSAGTDTNTPLITIRGQRPSEAKMELDPAAPMYFNEVVMSPSTGTNLAMYDLQSVQVVKGPQGTLFGRNSTGGAILLTPKRPGDELGGYVEVKLGDFDLKTLEGAIDVPLNEQFSARLAGRKTERDGYQENIADNVLNGDDARGEDSESIRLSVSYDGEKLYNLAVMAYDKNKSGSPVAQIVALNTSTQAGQGLIGASGGGYLAALQDIKDRDDPWEYKSDLEATDEVKNTFASNTTEFEINERLTIKNIIGYRKVERSAINDADGSEYALAGGMTDATLANPLAVTLNPELNTTKAEQFTNELQLLGTSFDDQLDWIVGAYWYEMKGTVVENLQQTLGFAYDWSTYSAENTATGLFAEGTFTFNDEWSVTAGLRQSWDEREITVSKYKTRPTFALIGGVPTLVGLASPDFADANCDVYAPGAVPGVDAALPNTACERTESEDYSQPTWRTSVNYTPEDGVLMYASISSGYKAGGFNARGTTDASLTPFDEEGVITYELGHKADWNFDWAPVRTNVAVFWQDYEDIQQTVSILDGASLSTQTINAAKAEIKGFEFDVTAAPTENLLLSMAYSYIDAGYKENETIDGFDLSDNDFVYIPEQSLTASVAYTLPVDESLGEMSLMASVYWQDDMTTHPLAGDFNALYSGAWSQADIDQAEEVSKVDAYEVVNLRFDWRNVMGSSVDVAAFVNNVNDEEYVLGGLNVIEVFYTGYTYGAPRTYGASMRYQF